MHIIPLGELTRFVSIFVFFFLYSQHPRVFIYHLSRTKRSHFCDEKAFLFPVFKAIILYAIINTHARAEEEQEEKDDDTMMKKQRVLAYARVRPSSNSFPTSPQKEKKIRGEDGDREEEEEHEEEDSKKNKKTKKKTRASLTDPGIVETARGHFRVDHAFGEDATQRDVWDAIGEPALTDVMRGEEACVIAYGQTGAGKTYALLNTPGMTSSMGGGLEKDFTSRRREEEEEGEEDDDDDDEEEEEEEEEERRNSAGLVPRLAVELFLRIDNEGKKKKVMKETKKNRRTKTTFVVEISMMQIYNEIVDDLLEDLEDGGNSATKKKMSDKSKRSASVSFNEKNGKTSRTKNVVRMNDVCNNN